jgi:hypothetical protein
MQWKQHESTTTCCGGWYRIPDSWRNVSCVSAAFTQYQEETCETHETELIGVLIRSTGPVARCLLAGQRVDERTDNFTRARQAYAAQD